MLLGWAACFLWKLDVWRLITDSSHRENMEEPLYKRILIKLSGEALMGEEEYGISSVMLHFVAAEVKSIVDLGVQVAIVNGGGNIFRGVQSTVEGLDRATADYMGMLATVMNALALQSALEQKGVPTRVQSAIEMKQLAETYIRRKAIRHVEKNRVVIFAAGTGNPYFTTDTAASLRAMEIDANVIIKATKVDGIYSADPVKNPAAIKYEKIQYIDVIKKGLSVMDSTAITLCMDNNLPIMILDLKKAGNLKRAILGERIGSIIGGD